MSQLVLWDHVTKQWISAASYTIPEDDGGSGGTGEDLPEGVWPNASNVGYLGDMGDLTPISGYTITTNGAVIENRVIADSMVLQAANVTIRNCVINAGWYGVQVHGNGAIIEDCTIIGGGNCGILADGNTNVTIRRCNLYGGADGMKLGGSYLTIRDCYIHDLDSEDEDPHHDGMQFSSGSYITIYNNYIHAKDTSCIAMFDGQGHAWSDVTIERNRLINPDNYLIYAGGSDASGVKIIDNVMGPWSHWAVTSWDDEAPGNVWSGNVDFDDNAISAIKP